MRFVHALRRIYADWSDDDDEWITIGACSCNVVFTPSVSHHSWTHAGNLTYRKWLDHLEDNARLYETVWYADGWPDSGKRTIHYDGQTLRKSPGHLSYSRRT
jgi:hypothetical protein